MEIKKKSSLAPWLNRYKWKDDLMILASEIQAVSELYHNKGAAVVQLSAF